MEKKRVMVRIEGLVQGVFFRGATRNAAVKEGVLGWVRNLPDGRVLAVFEGDAEAVDRMISWCRKGSSASRVDRVEVLEEDFNNEFDRFNIRH